MSTPILTTNDRYTMMQTELLFIDAASTLLYDGQENELFGQDFEISVNGFGTLKINAAEINENNFRDLDRWFSEDALAQVLKEKKFRFHPSAFDRYLGTDKLDLKYLMKENILVLFSLGEFQAGRYKFYYEGSWEIAAGPVI